MHRTIAAALVSALALGIASCGGTEARLTSAQLVAKVNAACIQARQASERQMRSRPSGGASTNSMQFVEGLIAGQKVLNERLGRFNPPDASKQDFEAFRRDMQQRLAIYQRVQGAGSANLRSEIASAQGPSLVLFRRLDALSKRLTFTGCV